MRLVEATPLSEFTTTKNVFQTLRRSRWFLGLLLFAGLTLRVGAQTDMTIYTDSIQNNWNDWSYFVTRDFNSTAVVHSGSKAIAVSLNTGTAYGALSLEHADINSSLYTSLTFWINGGPTGGQHLQVYAELSSATGTYAFGPSPWTAAATTGAKPPIANPSRSPCPTAAHGC